MSKKRTLLIVLGCFVLGLFMVACNSKSEPIVVIYENDVHCAAEGYTKIAAVRNEALTETPNVVLVSSGDYVSGGPLGAASHGEFIIKMMNQVGYDYVTLGNHEFDFGIPQMMANADSLTAKTLCCNMIDLRTNERLFDAYEIREFGKTRVAFVGISTPASISTSTPTYFMDAYGKFIYGFCSENIAEVLQQNVDQARSDGADYVIVLSHIGDTDEGFCTTPQLIGATNGIDVFLDGHSHSVIEGKYLNNKDGKPVLLTSTGTRFANAGKLVIDNGVITSKLIPLADYQGSVPEVDTCLSHIQADYQKIGQRVVGHADIALTVNGADGKRAVRSNETNLADFVTDALRITTGADIAWFNGGGIRASLPAGVITYNDLFTVFPFGNMISTAKVSGQGIVDALEMAVRDYPSENGAFPQTSGLQFTIDGNIASPVVMDANNLFERFEGEQRRVKDVMVLDKESGNYIPIDPNSVYTIAATNYCLFDHGNGISFGEPETVQKDICLEIEAVERYLYEYVGTIGPDYEKPQGRITFEKIK